MINKRRSNNPFTTSRLRIVWERALASSQSPVKPTNAAPRFRRGPRFFPVTRTCRRSNIFRSKPPDIVYDQQTALKQSLHDFTASHSMGDGLQHQLRNNKTEGVAEGGPERQKDMGGVGGRNRRALGGIGNVVTAQTVTHFQVSQGQSQGVSVSNFWAMQNQQRRIL